MKICFICCEYPPGPHGGIGTFTQTMARALVKAGHRVRVIGVYSAAYPVPDYEEDQGVRIWRLREPVHKLGWGVARYNLYLRLAEWSQAREIDLIEVPDWQGWAAGWPRLAVPVIGRLHGSATYLSAELGRPLSTRTFLLERTSLHRTDVWCSVSQYAADKTQLLFGLRNGPGAILYNPVDLSPEKEISPRHKARVVFTGTLTGMKGIHQLLRSWPGVVKQNSQAELHIYGKEASGEGNGSVKSLLSAQSKTVRDSVVFKGHTPHEMVLRALKSARVAIFPSFAEAFAIAPLEAMACGCPTIYTKRCSGPELIEHEQNGLLVDPAHSDEITANILRLLGDDVLAMRLGTAGRKTVEEKFSLKALLKLNVAFYQQCASEFAAA